MKTNKRSRGQSTVEFALMMPFMLGITFFVLEFQIFAVGMHHTAWAAYSAARAQVVMHGNKVDLQSEVIDEILNGRIYQQQRPSVDTHRRGFNGNDSKWNQGQPDDGVVVTMPGFGSLPYARALLNIDTEIPTHLGPDEWDRQIEGNDNDNERRWDRTSSGGKKTLTDNNQDDF